MINRGFIYILATLIVGLNVFPAFAEPGKFDPKILAQTFMASVGAIQAETNVTLLKNYNNQVAYLADSRAQILSYKNTKVESIHDKIKDLDDAIAVLSLRIWSGAGPGTTDEQKAQLKDLKTQRKQLVSEEKTAYKDYVNFRGQSIVAIIMFEALMEEVAKRLAQLDNNTATGNFGNNTAIGTWSMVLTLGESKSTRAGDFSLTIATNGVITGISHERAMGEFSISGKWNPADGKCDWKVNDTPGGSKDNQFPAIFRGNLKKGPGGYAGNGTFEYKNNIGATSSEEKWSTTK